MSNKLVIAYFYKKLLNLYGDNGNVEILIKRASDRDIEVALLEIDIDTKIDSDIMRHVNLAFMGGGPDSGQKSMYADLFKNKGEYLKEYVEAEGVGLYVCGSYQLLGYYYKAADGEMLEGLGAFDLYTRHFGNKQPRCIGNTVATLSSKITEDPVFKAVNKLDNVIVGFENHGGRTYLGNSVDSFATVSMGHGNNSEDKTEGVFYKNSIGTYFHGPLLARNPHLADFLIAKALHLDTLKELDDSLIYTAHTASQALKQ
jgi:lipid II isoglutaminyl synthase (glutamine-hydrolysing)